MKNLYLGFNLLVCFFIAGCGGSDTKEKLSSSKNLEAKIVQIETDLKKMSRSLEMVASKMESLDSLQIQMDNLADRLSETKASSMDVYQRLLAEVSRYSELSKNQLQDYEMLIEKMEDRLDKNIEEHRSNVSDFEKAISSIERSIDSMRNSRSNLDTTPLNYENETDDVTGDGSSKEIKGVVRKGKISGLKRGYMTY